MNAIQRAMQIREEPNDPESPDFRPGLLVKRAILNARHGAHGQQKRLHPSPERERRDREPYRGSIFFLPIHGTSASGTTIEPSEHW